MPGVVVGAGAKILGPFFVGDNSKIGSNAVVLNSVPADSTVVGVLAREVLVQPNDTEKIYDNDLRLMVFLPLQTILLRFG